MKIINLIPYAKHIETFGFLIFTCIVFFLGYSLALKQTNSILHYYCFFLAIAEIINISVFIYRKHDLKAPVKEKAPEIYSFKITFIDKNGKELPCLNKLKIE